MNLTQLSSSSFLGSVSSGGSGLDLAPLPFLALAGLPLLAREVIGLLGLSCWLVDEVGRDPAGWWYKHVNMYSITLQHLIQIIYYMYIHIWILSLYLCVMFPLTLHLQASVVHGRRFDCEQYPHGSRPELNSTGLERRHLCLTNPKIVNGIREKELHYKYFWNKYLYLIQTMYFSGMLQFSFQNWSY